MNPWNKKDYYNPVTKKGAIRIRLPIDDPYYSMADAQGYIHEHRYIMAKFLGRLLKPKEVVHHLNKNIRDNRIENLQLFANHADHMSQHMTPDEARKRMAAHGIRRGEKHHAAKLHGHQVIEIRESYQKGIRGKGLYAMAIKYNVAPITIWMIVNNKRWTHLLP